MTPHDDTDDSGDATERSEPTGVFGSPTDTRRDLLKKGAATSAALGLGLSATGGAAAADDDRTDDDGNEGRGKGSRSTSVTFQNQITTDDTVVVESVTLSRPGYVAIHDASLLEGAVLESVIGVSEFLTPGTYENLEVELFDVRGADLGDYELADDDLLIAMPHRETSDNEEYDFVESGGEEDGPFTRAGQPVVDLGYVRVHPIATVEFRNQETDGGTVVVESVFVSEGGFVAIHDASLFDGVVLESVVGVSEYLEPGMHEDVEIDLFDVEGASFDQSQLESTQPLLAMPHLDTDGNEEYDFVESGGQEDGPYTRNGNFVGDLGYAVLE